jgi:hypothetical protein
MNHCPSPTLRDKNLNRRLAAFDQNANEGFSWMMRRKKSNPEKLIDD